MDTTESDKAIKRVEKLLQENPGSTELNRMLQVFEQVQASIRDTNDDGTFSVDGAEYMLCCSICNKPIGGNDHSLCEQE